MTRRTHGPEGTVHQVNGQRTPPINEPLDPGPDGHQPVNGNNTNEPQPKPSTPNAKSKRRVKPTRIPPDIMP